MQQTQRCQDPHDGPSSTEQPRTLLPRRASRGHIWTSMDRCRLTTPLTEHRPQTSQAAPSHHKGFCKSASPPDCMPTARRGATCVMWIKDSHAPTTSNGRRKCVGHTANSRGKWNDAEGPDPGGGTQQRSSQDGRGETPGTLGGSHLPRFPSTAPCRQALQHSWSHASCAYGPPLRSSHTPGPLAGTRARAQPSSF